jgi:hypothetical protein
VTRGDPDEVAADTVLAVPVASNLIGRLKDGLPVINREKIRRATLAAANFRMP